MVDFLITGAQKCGTTSLHRYLAAHPKIEMPPSKELDFFSNDKYFYLGLDYYLSFFQHIDNSDIKCGEASPQYMYSPLAPSRIHAAFPNVRLIMCIRDPIERAQSHLQMNRKRGIEERTLMEAFKDFVSGNDPHADDPSFSYFRLGEYGGILETYLRYFRNDQILFVYSDELRNHRRDTLDRVLTFLHVDGQIPDDVLEFEYYRSGRQRFPRLGYGVRWLGKLSPQLNCAIKSIIGTHRIYSLLHKFETEWNHLPQECSPVLKLAEHQKLEISQYFAADAALFKKLSGQCLPWACPRNET